MKDKKEKYDWAAEKREYFESDIAAVKVFFESKYGVWTGTMSRNTNGWNGEKKIFRSQLETMALEKFKERQSDEVSNAMSEMVSTIVDDVKAKSFVNAKGKKLYWEMLRTEAGLPTRITHNTNLNTEVEDEKQAVSNLKKQLHDRKQNTSPAKTGSS